MKQAVCLLCVLLATSNAFAQTAKINAPASVPQGKLVKLSASFSLTRGRVEIDAQGADEEADSVDFDWALPASPPDYEIAEFISDDGRNVFFSTGHPGTYTFTMAVARIEPGGRAKASMAMHTIKVLAGPGTEPPVEPEPEPEPTPPEEPSEPDAPSFGLTDAVREWSPPHGKSSDLAASYKATALKIALGELDDVNAIMNHQRMENRRILGAADQILWREFFTWLGKRMDVLAQQGKLATPGDYGFAFIEISNGLRAK